MHLRKVLHALEGFSTNFHAVLSWSRQVAVQVVGNEDWEVSHTEEKRGKMCMKIHVFRVYLHAS